MSITFSVFGQIQFHFVRNHKWHDHIQRIYTKWLTCQCLLHVHVDIYVSLLLKVNMAKLLAVSCHILDTNFSIITWKAMCTGVYKYILRTILFQYRMHFLHFKYASRSLPILYELLLEQILKLSSIDFWVIAHCSLTLVNMTWNTALFWDTVSVKTRRQCLKVRPHGLLCII